MTERKRKALAITGVAVFLAAILLIGWRVGLPMIQLVSEPETFRQWVEGYGPAGRFLYMGMVILQILVAFIPGEPLEIAGGYVFGAAWGTALCLLADAIGSLLVFLLVRRFGVRLVSLFFSEEKLRSVGFLKSSPRRNLLFFLIFLIPGTPKDLLCYFAGLTGLRLPVFLLIASLGRLPSVVTSTVGGDALGTKRYGIAAAVFAATLLISGTGLYVYHKIQRRSDSP